MVFFEKKTAFDLICIGDLVVDNYIRLKEADIRPNDRKDRVQLCLSFGDKVPYDSETLVPAGGNSPNASVAAARLGLSAALISNIGRDDNGASSLSALKAAGVDTRFVTVHDGNKTNYHFVLWYGDDRTILIKHEEYPYSLPEFQSPKWLYLSSLGEHSLPFHDRIADWLDKNPDTKLTFQPGTYQLRFGAMKLARIYRRTEFFFCNREEARKILDTKDNDIRHLSERLADLGPRYVFITDGREGAYCFRKKDRALFYISIYPDPRPAIERTGAGDAFASTVTAAAMLGCSFDESMQWGIINAMSVVQHVGAQAGLLNSDQIKEFLARAPEEFKPQKM
jgi:sugar/nucleoside kinase (ribokinase family)